MNEKLKFTLLIALLALGYGAGCLIAALNGGDFDVYLDAASKLAHHQNIYAPPFYRGFQYYYSPLFALLLIPLTGHNFIAAFCWSLLSGAMLVRTIQLLTKYLDLSLLTSRQFHLMLFISCFFIFRFLLYNMTSIQVTLFLLWAIFESLHLIQGKKWWLGSLLLALAINFKLMPLVILPYLVYRARWKSVTAVMVFSVFFLFLPALFIGVEYNHFLLGEWWKIINPANSEHLVENDISAQSVMAITHAFLSDTPSKLDLHRNFLNLDHHVSNTISNILRLGLIALTLFFLRSPFRAAPNLVSEIRALGYICLLIPLIFPHQQKYAFIFLLPMIMYLTYYCMVRWKDGRTRAFTIFLILLLMVSLIFTPLIGTDIIGKYPYDVLHHFKLLGLSAMCLIVFGILAKPGDMLKYHPSSR